LFFVKETEFAHYSAVDDPSAAPLTGIALGWALLDFLRTLGVSTVHMGTQTADWPLLARNCLSALDAG